MSELTASEHYGTVAAVARENNLTVYGEALEGGRPSLGDDMALRKYTDVPMAALWTNRKEGKHNPVYVADMKGAASVAHVYGQNIVAACLPWRSTLTHSGTPPDHQCGSSVVLRSL